MVWYEWVLGISGGLLTFGFGGGLLAVSFKAVGALVGIRVEMAELKGEVKGLREMVEQRFERVENDQSALNKRVSSIERDCR